jgi:hypothetical protein
MAAALADAQWQLCNMARETVFQGGFMKKIYCVQI